jgi:DNA-binding NarL/FixJ family response regulator
MPATLKFASSAVVTGRTPGVELDDAKADLDRLVALTAKAQERYDRVREAMLAVLSEPSAKLTQRERQVRELAKKGLQDKEVAAKLGVSPRTVKFHMSSILRKLELQSRREL